MDWCDLWRSYSQMAERIEIKNPKNNTAEGNCTVALGSVLLALIRTIIVKNKSEPISIYEIVRICCVWWPVRESNSCLRRERAMSWPLDQRALFILSVSQTASILYYIKCDLSIPFFKKIKKFMQKFMWKLCVSILKNKKSVPQQRHTEKMHLLLLSHKLKIHFGHKQKEKTFLPNRVFPKRNIFTCVTCELYHFFKTLAIYMIILFCSLWVFLNVFWDFIILTVL